MCQWCLANALPSNPMCKTRSRLINLCFGLFVRRLKIICASFCTELFLMNVTSWIMQLSFSDEHFRFRAPISVGFCSRMLFQHWFNILSWVHIKPIILFMVEFSFLPPNRLNNWKIFCDLFIYESIGWRRTKWISFWNFGRIGAVF